MGLHPPFLHWRVEQTVSLEGPSRVGWVVRLLQVHMTHEEDEEVASRDAPEGREAGRFALVLGPGTVSPAGAGVRGGQAGVLSPGTEGGRPA